MSTAPITPVSIVNPAGHPLTRPRISSVAELESVWTRNAEIEWVVKDMIPKASVNLISAESGTGKSWLAYGIAGAVARGVSFIGLEVHQMPVLYLDGENPLCVVRRNLDDLGIRETEDLRVWGGWNLEEAPRPLDDRIRRFAGEEKPLLIWDSLVEFALCDEQSSTEMRAFMNHFRDLANLGATIVVLHHTGKSDTSKEYRGSTDIKASVDMAYLVKGQTAEGKLHRLHLKPFKSRIAPLKEFAMEFRQGTGFEAREVPQQARAVDPVQVLDRIVREHPRSNGTQIKTLARAAGVPRNQAERILQSHRYRVEHGRGAALLYSIIEEAQVPDLPDPRV